LQHFTLVGNDPLMLVIISFLKLADLLFVEVFFFSIFKDTKFKYVLMFVGWQDSEINKFKAATNDEIERLKNQLKWQVRWHGVF